MVLVKWFKRDGTVEGTVKMWPSYYRLNSPHNTKPYPVTPDEYCSAISTDG